MVYETIKSILFYLDTRARSSGTIGAPRFTFPNNLINLQPQNGELIRLTLQEVSLEYTFYQTEQFNNKFLVEERAIENGILQTDDRFIEFEIGNYNLQTFVVELTQKLNQNSLYYTYVVTYLPNVNGLRYLAEPKPGVTIPPAPPPPIIFNFNRDDVFQKTGIDIGESANEIMGFTENAIIGLVEQPNNTLLCTSNAPITVSGGVQNLYVTVTNACSNYGNTSVKNDFTTSNILGKIPVATPPFSVLYFYDINANFATIIQNKYIDNLNISLFNERFTQIEPRKDWSLTCKIEIIRPRAENATQMLIQELLELEKLKLARKEKNSKKTEKNNRILRYNQLWQNPTLRDLQSEPAKASKKPAKSSERRAPPAVKSSTPRTASAEANSPKAQGS